MYSDTCTPDDKVLHDMHQMLEAWNLISRPMSPKLFMSDDTDNSIDLYVYESTGYRCVGNYPTIHQALLAYHSI